MHFITTDRREAVNFVAQPFIMDTPVIIILAFIFLLILGVLFYSYRGKKEPPVQPAVGSGVQASLPLRLQAYERLVLLTERIALPNLISRTGMQDMYAKDMQQLLTLSIRQEYEHNVSQQIYVSQEAWEAVRNLKEQNMLIVNQVASFLPDDATGVQLNKSILDLLMQNPNASMHNLVSEALSYEAKQLM